jgi:hypothetical protein
VFRCSGSPRHRNPPQIYHPDQCYFELSPMKAVATLAGYLLLFPAAVGAQASGDLKHVIAEFQKTTQSPPPKGPSREELTLVIGEFQKTIQLAKAGLPRIASLMPWLVVFAFGTIILAATGTIIQAFEKPWVKPTTIVLGGIVTLIGSLKATFYAIDYATCAQTISDMQGTISKAEEEIQNYQKEGLTENTRAAYLRLIEANVDTLRKLDNLFRASGHAILPPSFIAIAYAQSQSQRPFDTVRQTGSVIASSKTAGYEFAKYQALETIARERLKARDSQLDTAIQYLQGVAQPGNVDCRPEGKMFNCTFEVTITAAYLNPALVQSFGTPSEEGRPKTDIAGPVFILDDGPNIITAIALRSGISARVRDGQLNTIRGLNGFAFRLLREPKTQELGIQEIDAAESGVWSFEFSSAGGASAILPVRSYFGKSSVPVQYRLPSLYQLHLREVDGIAGYLRKPPQN